MKFKGQQLFAATAFLLLGLAALLLGRDIPRGTISNPGPGFFPFWVALILVILAGAHFPRILRSRAAAEETEKISSRNISLVMVALYAYVLLMPLIGYELATLGLMGFMLWLFGVRPLSIGVISVLASGISAFLFGFLLRVPLPLIFFPLH